MNALLDTNILVDFLAKRPLFFNNAESIIKKCKNDEITGVVAIHTISTLFYILKKYIPSDSIRELFYSLFTIIGIGSADKESVLHALKNKAFPDFEDGLQYQCALEESVDCIITRNQQPRRSASGLLISHCILYLDTVYFS